MLLEYKQLIEAGELALFGFYKNGERSGSAIARIFLRDGIRIMEAAEVGGKGLSVPKFYFPWFIALAKKLKCDKFLIGTTRKGMKKFAKEQGFQAVYTEFEIDVKKVIK